MNVLQIDLWKCYISYVRETKSSLSGFRYDGHTSAALTAIAIVARDRVLTLYTL